MNRETAVPSVTELPGKRAREWSEYHHRSAAKTTYVYDFVWDVTEPAEGPFCTDVDGNLLLDFTSHVGAAPLGYNNPKLMDRMSEFELVDPTKIAGQDFYVSSGELGDHDFPAPADLMDRLTDLSSHYGMDTVFLSNSGAEAVENALKIAYDHTAGKYGITCQGAFHGRTLGALSLNRSKAKYRRKYPEIQGIHDVPFCEDSGCTAGTCTCGFFADGESQLRRMLDPETGYVGPDEVAYLIMEPIQGEGGYRFPSEAFTDEIAAVRDRHDLILIADEIQSGIGRTGEMWAADHYAIEPDVITSAKALRVGATIANEDVFPDERGRISSTWGAGDLLAAMQGALTLEIIEDHDLMDNAVERGAQFKQRLDDADHDTIVDVRGKGLMLAVEFDTEQRRDDVLEAAMKRGLLTLGCGDKSLRFLPPLDVREREIDLAIEYLGRAIEDAV